MAGRWPRPGPGATQGSAVAGAISTKSAQQTVAHRGCRRVNRSSNAPDGPGQRPGGGQGRGPRPPGHHHSGLRRPGRAGATDQFSVALLWRNAAALADARAAFTRDASREMDDAHLANAPPKSHAQDECFSVRTRMFIVGKQMGIGVNGLGHLDTDAATFPIYRTVGGRSCGVMVAPVRSMTVAAAAEPSSGGAALPRRIPRLRFCRNHSGLRRGKSMHNWYAGVVDAPTSWRRKIAVKCRARRQVRLSIEAAYETLRGVRHLLTDCSSNVRRVAVPGRHRWRLLPTAGHLAHNMAS